MRARMRRELLLSRQPFSVPSGAVSGPQLFGSRNFFNEQFVTDAGGTFRGAQQDAKVSVTSIQMVFINGCSVAAAQDATGTTYTIGKVYWEGPSVSTQAFFPGGSASKVMAPGEIAIATASVSHAAGSAGWPRTEVPAGTYPILHLAAKVSGQEGRAPGVFGIVQNTGVGGFTDQVAVHGPVLVLGTKTSGTPVPVYVQGNSGAEGTGDLFNTPIAIGFLYRGLSPTYPLALVAKGGEAYYPGVETQTALRSLLYGTGAGYFIDEYGGNDFQTGRGLAATQASALANAATRQAAFPNQRIFGITHTPKTTSGDGWTSQTQTPDANYTTVPDYNSWARDDMPIIGGVAVAPGTAGATRTGKTGGRHPYYDYLDIATLCESGPTTQKWANGATDDGIHPNSARHIYIAANVPWSTKFPV